MIPRINLLPHRERRREQRKKEFVSLGVLVALLAGVSCAAIAFVIGARVDDQRARNELIRSANVQLDEKLKEVATLSADIEALHARQDAVESLQMNRTMIVHLLDELVTQTPEGLFLKSVRQNQDRRILLGGYADSNERVSEYLRNLSGGTRWLGKPELLEIKSANPAGSGNRKSGSKAGPADTGSRLFEFSLNVTLNDHDSGNQSSPQKVARGPAASGVSAAAVR